MSQPTYAVVGDIKGDFTKMITTASCPKLGNEVSATRVTIQTPNIVCTYDGTQVAASETRVNNWLTSFGALGSSPSDTVKLGFQTLMPLYCGQNSATHNFSCTQGTQCSRVFQTPPPDSPIHPCMSWYQGLQSQAEDSATAEGQLNAFISSYCGAYPDSVECKCVQGLNDPLYATLAQTSNSVGGCWYAPCTGVGSATQFQPTNVVPGRYGNPPCPTQVCNSVLQFVNANPTIQSSTFAQNIQCNETTTTGGGGTLGSPAPAPAPAPEPSGAASLLSKYWYWFLIGLVLLVALAIGGALLSRRKPAPTPEVKAAKVTVAPGQVKLTTANLPAPPPV
jgi:hypothetical protein